VAGHDRNAAAAMAQVRNVLRGVAQVLDDPPGAVLTGLDRALARLEVTTLATAVLCQVGPAQQGDDSLQLRWSNAGHPPPLLLQPDGQCELLARDPELLLGISPSEARRDHVVALPAGTTLVLYTDGLVERRDQSLDDGLERLRLAAAELRHLSPDALCDALLAQLAAGAEDDVALLVLRVGG
jgi:serine phosphatase RsbU (regulator of sigma subunit)